MNFIFSFKEQHNGKSPSLIKFQQQNFSIEDELVLIKYKWTNQLNGWTAELISENAS